MSWDVRDFLYSPKYYAIDSAVYFSFERVSKIDLLIQACENRCVLTPKVEEEIFGRNKFDTLLSDFRGGTTVRHASMFNRWIREPKSTLGLFIFGDDPWNNDSYCTGNCYRDYFYIANVDYSSTSYISNWGIWQVDTSKLKKKADAEILKWAASNSQNAVLLANERLLVRLARESNTAVMGSVGILIKAVKERMILMEEAKNIYNRWSIVDRGSCIWQKLKKDKKLINFEDIYHAKDCSPSIAL